MTDLAMLDATAQAELVRRKEVKPIELVDAAIERIERANPTHQRRHHADVRPGAKGGLGAAARRALHRRALPAQGPDGGLRAASA